MKKKNSFIQMILIGLCLTFTAAVIAQKGATSGAGRWLAVNIGVIGTASDDVLSNTMKNAEENNYDGVLIVLDTPGGALESTRAMVQTIMASSVPVAVWVGPSGSRAGSAGAFITMAAHIAAMAPGTNIGAAHPVQASGKDVGDEQLSKKVENDTVAFIESIAQSRGRNVELARSFVVLSTSITANEALEQNIVDIIAPSAIDLLRSIDGRELKLSNQKTVKLETSTAVIDYYEYSLRQELLTILSNPNLFYLLFLAGIIGLGFELTNPGSLFPGVIGAICLVLALIATSVLPVSFGAVLLTLAGVAFLVAEVFVPSFGILGIGGFAAFVLGSFLLVDPSNEQGLRISVWTIVPGALLVGTVALGIGYLLLKSERRNVNSGAETMIGKTATTVDEFCEGKGKVFFEGEIWSAKCIAESGAELAKDQSVYIEKREGLTLIVRR